MTMRFAVGDRVAVRRAYPPGHVRAPYFARGKKGVVLNIFGTQPNPEELAYGRDGLPELPLYHVLFRQIDLWPDYKGPAKDTAVVAVYENWLEKS
jgi:nitrile hydratase